MCTDCGCSVVGEVGISSPHNHLEHEHHHHHHTHENSEHRTVAIAQSILNKNDRLAERNRGYFLAKELLVLNILSSPGSGKTTFIQKMLADMGENLPTGVIVGDLETDNDAQRLRSTGAPVVQITTGSVCHLEADMVMRAARQLNLDILDLLIIENVGNLVCPAAYDLGEDLRVVLFSVTEGEDKPLKYPTMFKTAQVVILSKIDIAEAVEFNREQAINNIKRVSPQAIILEVSARTGEGMKNWYAYVRENLSKYTRIKNGS
jgi:hydrogenase nickel incorporation protein HypB